MTRMLRTGPVLLTTTAANVLNPPAASGGVGVGTVAAKLEILHLRIVNVTAAAASFSAWLGATGASAAGTEVFGIDTPVPANRAVDIYLPGLRLVAADFLVMKASTASALVVTIESELSFV